MGNFWLRLSDRIGPVNTLIAGIVITVFNLFSDPIAVESAEQIRFWYPPAGEFTIYVSDLERFAKDGKLSKRLAFYLERLSSQQQAQWEHLSLALSNYT